jgi:hypothetical protein
MIRSIGRSKTLRASVNAIRGRRGGRWPQEIVRRPPECPRGWRFGPPDFVGVGVQRACTTWWYNLVSDHPQVAIVKDRPKELHYFDRFWSEPFTDQNIDEYHRFFPRPAGKLSGEWTPRYMLDLWTPELLKAAAPDTKILVLLRDPIERCVSGITRAIRVGAPRNPIIVNDSVSRGLYFQQLSRLLDHFDRDQVLVLQFERCLSERTTELEKTYRFLGLHPADHVPARLAKAATKKTGPKAQVSGHLRSRLVEFFAQDVEELIAAFPEIDLTLWGNFKDLDRSAARP